MRGERERETENKERTSRFLKIFITDENNDLKKDQKFYDNSSAEVRVTQYSQFLIPT